MHNLEASPEASLHTPSQLAAEAFIVLPASRLKSSLLAYGTITGRLLQEGELSPLCRLAEAVPSDCHLCSPSPWRASEVWLGETGDGVGEGELVVAA